MTKPTAEASAWPAKRTIGKKIWYKTRPSPDRRVCHFTVLQPANKRRHTPACAGINSVLDGGRGLPYPPPRDTLPNEGRLSGRIDHDQPEARRAADRSAL